ncbi:hypothetical protein NED98_00010 [Sphingomonas sp. MMSM20]|nr:hypothetical protein [Sphingomonas lycopersici]
MTAIREIDWLAPNQPFVQVRGMRQYAKLTRTIIGPLLAVVILVAVFGGIALLALSDV